MSLEAVAYTSSAIHGITDDSLEILLLGARKKNEELGVTGVLLYHDGSFFQYFEGSPNAVEEVYDRIRRSPMHHGIVELVEGPIDHRSFSNWLMGFTRAPATKLLQLSNASWKARMTQANFTAPTVNSDGLDLLLQFWASNRRRMY